MALSATRTTAGFEFLHYTTEHEVMWVPGDPGDTYTAGDIVTWTIGEGHVDPCAANEGGMVGRVLATTVCPAATTAFPKPADFKPGNPGQSTYSALIPIQPVMAKGTPVFLATFENQTDETVVSYTVATRAIAETTGHGADDRPNGGLLYVYEGPGIGEVNLVEDYDHTGGAAELLLITHRVFETTLTTASKYIVLSGEAAANCGVGFFTHMESSGATKLTTNQGTNDGDWAVYLDWRDSARYLRDLMLPVVPARYLMLA